MPAIGYATRGKRAAPLLVPLLLRLSLRDDLRQLAPGFKKVDFESAGGLVPVWSSIPCRYRLAKILDVLQRESVVCAKAAAKRYEERGDDEEYRQLFAASNKLYDEWARLECACVRE